MGTAIVCIAAGIVFAPADLAARVQVCSVRNGPVILRDFEHVRPMVELGKVAKGWQGFFSQPCAILLPEHLEWSPDSMYSVAIVCDVAARYPLGRQWSVARSSSRVVAVPDRSKHDLNVLCVGCPDREADAWPALAIPVVFLRTEPSAVGQVVALFLHGPTAAGGFELKDAIAVG